MILAVFVFDRLEELSRPEEGRDLDLVDVGADEIRHLRAVTRGAPNGRRVVALDGDGGNCALWPAIAVNREACAALGVGKDDRECLLAFERWGEGWGRGRRMRGE